ncbi:response regulator [candidate division KSB1 bacterium]|nr:response regulator [candidate division KSB1 bacterium]
MAKIVVIDDDPNNLLLYREILEEEGHQTLTVADSRQAHAIIRKESPDIILCDIIMPKLSGVELCELVKCDEGTKNIPIILMSGIFDHDDARKKMKQAGYQPDDYLVKPFDNETLLIRIKNLLKERGQQT